jgi:hypothetical protein
MSETHGQVLAERIGRLEKKLKSSRLLLGIGILLLIVKAFGDSFFTRDVYLTNTASGATAAIQTERSGRTGLYFFDHQLVVRAEIGLEADGSPSLVLRDKENKVLFKAP